MSAFDNFRTLLNETRCDLKLDYTIRASQRIKDEYTKSVSNSEILLLHFKSLEWKSFPERDMLSLNKLSNYCVRITSKMSTGTIKTGPVLSYL